MQQTQKYSKNFSCLQVFICTMLITHCYWSEILDLNAEIILIFNCFHSHDSNIILIYS